MLCAILSNKRFEVSSFTRKHAKAQTMTIIGRINCISNITPIPPNVQLSVNYTTSHVPSTYPSILLLMNVINATVHYTFDGT